MKNIFLFLFFSILGTSINAQKISANKIKFPESFKLGKQVFLNSTQFIAPKFFREYGYDIKSNPGIIKDKEAILPFIENLNPSDIFQVYFEIYGPSSGEIEEVIAVSILEFYSDDLIMKNLKILNEPDSYAPFFLVIGKYLIVIRSGDQDLIRKVAKHYEEKLDITPIIR